MPQQVPITETHPQAPINPYGASKLMMERMVIDSHVWGLRTAMLRYFNAAGSDPEAKIGEEHNPESHLIPRILDVAMGRAPQLTVFGDDYDTPDGTCVRDYIHVCDLADAHVLALRHLMTGAETAAFNLGTGTGFSVRQVLDATAKVTGRKIATALGPRRPGDPSTLVADSARAKTVLGWRPQRSGLEDQIGDAWRWWQHKHAGA
jgi:UDP-glucose-4-epimerase GalE